MMTFVSCAEKKKTENIITTKPVVKAPSAPVKMQKYSHRESVDWLDGKYEVVVSREVDESAPVFSDDSGSKYYDNRLTLTVLRPDGTEFFKREFTKQSFSQFADQQYISKSTVLGVAVDRVDGDRLLFVGSIGCPDQLSDDFVPIQLALSRSGELSMKKGEDIGASGSPDEY